METYKFFKAILLISLLFSPKPTNALTSFPAVDGIFKYDYVRDYVVFSNGKDIYKSSPLSSTPITVSKIATLDSNALEITFFFTSDTEFGPILMRDSSNNVYYYDEANSKFFKTLVVSSGTIKALDGYYTSDKFLIYIRIFLSVQSFAIVINSNSLTYDSTNVHTWPVYYPLSFDLFTKTNINSISSQPNFQFQRVARLEMESHFLTQIVSLTLENSNTIQYSFNSGYFAYSLSDNGIRYIGLISNSDITNSVTKTPIWTSTHSKTFIALAINSDGTKVSAFDGTDLIRYNDSGQKSTFSVPNLSGVKQMGYANNNLLIILTSQVILFETSQKNLPTCQIGEYLTPDLICMSCHTKCQACLDYRRCTSCKNRI